MLQVYLRYKAEIIWHILASDLDKETIQDVMFIIQLPRSAGPVYAEEDYEPWKAVVSQWISQSLHDPVASQDKSSQLFWSLNKLHSALMRLIEDYVTKAEAEYIVQIYSCLPQMGLSQRHLTFKGMEIMARMDAGLLRQSERIKLLKYFILYEWMAKAMRSNQMFVLRSLDDDVEPLSYGHRSLSLLDKKAWFGVKTYVASLYQAIFAQITEGVFPEFGLDFCPQTGRLYPHFASISPAIYSS